MSTATAQETNTSVSNAALLLFSLGPVQPFIEKARTVRDLTTGSYLLAWLTSKAAAPILDRADCQLVTPNEALVRNAKSPTMPNRFIARVPAGEASAFASECCARLLTAWTELCQTVHDKISPLVQQILNEQLGSEHNPGTEANQQLRNAMEHWDCLWQRQLGLEGHGCPFDVHAHVVPIENDQITAATCLFDGSKNDREPWDVFYQLTWSMDAVRKQTRYLHRYCAVDVMGGNFVPMKCTMFSAYEQLGPANVDASRLFWELMAGQRSDENANGQKGLEIDASRLRSRERLCALGMVKRFAWFSFLKKELSDTAGTDEDLSFSDTATIAAADWFNDAAKGGVLIDRSRIVDKKGKPIPWNGQWLHWQTESSDDEERPCPEELFAKIRLTRDSKRGIPKVPTYYAILMLDGDRMSQFGRRLNGSSEQMALSQTIAGFAKSVQKIVEERYSGELVYAGGDDVLALLPLKTALDCGIHLWNEFLSIWKTPYWNVRIARNKDGLTPTCSAGLAIVHYKEDLRFALDAARKVEKRAKSCRTTKNALAITVCRRSGEHSTAETPWEFVETTVNKWVGQFLKSNDTGSDAWTYNLARELPTLEGLENPEAIKGEIARLVHRSKVKMDSKVVADAFGAYHAFRQDADAHPTDAGFREKPKQIQDQEILASAIRGFVTLSQTASFLARGRDE